MSFKDIHKSLKNKMMGEGSFINFMEELAKRENAKLLKNGAKK